MAMNELPPPRYDPLKTLLAESQQVVDPPPMIEDVLHIAKRDVGVRDMMGLMFVNLWVVIAKILMPFFVVSRKSKKDVRRGEQDG